MRVSTGIQESAQFCTTHWTLVVACQEDHDSPAAREARASLYRAYWYPLYAYVRRHGANEHDAQDLVQSFILHLEGTDAVKKADAARGKFRTFLLSALRNFLANASVRERAQKRGGGRELLSLDVAQAEQQYQREPAHHVTPEAIFEVRWAHALLEQTLAALRHEFAARDKMRLFDGLQSFLTADTGETSYQAAADQLGLPLSAVKTSVHRLRRDYRARLREEIGRTVASPDEVDEELRHLRAVLAGGSM